MPTPIADRIAEVTRILMNPAWEKDQLAGVLRVVKAMGEEVDEARRDKYKPLWAVVNELGLGGGGCPDSLILTAFADLKRERDLAVAHDRRLASDDRQCACKTDAQERVTEPCLMHHEWAQTLRSRLALAETVVEAARDVRALFSETPVGIGYGVTPWRVEDAVRRLRASIETYDAAKSPVGGASPLPASEGGAAAGPLPVAGATTAPPSPEPLLTLADKIVVAYDRLCAAMEGIPPMSGDEAAAWRATSDAVRDYEAAKEAQPEGSAQIVKDAEVGLTTPPAPPPHVIDERDPKHWHIPERTYSRAEVNALLKSLRERCKAIIFKQPAVNAIPFSNLMEQVSLWPEEGAPQPEVKTEKEE